MDENRRLWVLSGTVVVIVLVVSFLSLGLRAGRLRAAA